MGAKEGVGLPGKGPAHPQEATPQADILARGLYTYRNAGQGALEVSLQPGTFLLY